MKMCFVPRTRWLALALAAMAGFAALPSAARADSETFTLTTSNLSPNPAGPYATVNVDLTSSTTANVTFTSLDPTKFLFAGGTGTLGLNVNSTTAPFTITNVTGTGPNPALSQDNGKNEDGFGQFTLNLSLGNSAVAEASGSFTLTDPNANWLSVADVLTGNGPNGSGNEVAAHILFLGLPTNANTGFVVPNGPGVLTPEFGSVTLMSIMLLGFGGITGFRRLRKPAMA